MSNSSYKGMVSGSVWGIIAKVIDAAAKFITIPLLVSFYGKVSYGLVALAFSLNAYLRLMDMGMNVGSIRFFSIWIAEKKWLKLADVSRSSIVFYGVIGIINALVFAGMAQYSDHFFKLQPLDVPVFRWIMYILAASAIFNWTSNVISQLLSAHNEIAWINKVTIVSSILNLLTAYIAIKVHLSLSVYFVIFTLSTLVIIPLNIYRLKVYNMPVMQLITPKWNGKAFKEILGYSLAIFAMGIFQFSADNLRPILLGKYAANGIAVLTDYRVIQTISMLVIAFGGVFSQVLLPSASKMYSEGNREQLEVMIYKGTKYISIFLALVVFCLVSIAGILLNIYMGNSYGQLEQWLILWLITVLVSMHNAPVSSLVLSTGNTKPLVYMSAFSCIVTLPITALLAKRYDVGAAVMGYFVYTVFQNLFFYIYYTPRILKLNSGKIFLQSLLPPVFAGMVSWAGVYGIMQLVNVHSGIIILIARAAIFFIIYLTLTLVFVIDKDELKFLTSKLQHFKNRGIANG